MKKLHLWEGLIFVTVDGTLINILYTIKINFGKVLTTIIKDKEELPSQENIGKVTSTD